MHSILLRVFLYDVLEHVLGVPHSAVFYSEALESQSHCTIETFRCQLNAEPDSIGENSMGKTRSISNFRSQRHKAAPNTLNTHTNINANEHEKQRIIEI